MNGLAKTKPMTIRTYNIPLMMDNDTETHWLNTLSALKRAFNRAVELIASQNVTLSIVPVHNACYDKLRTEFPELPSQMAIRTQKEAMAMLKSRKSNKHHGELPKKHSMSITLDKRLYSNLSPKGISLSGGEKGKRTHVPFAIFPKADEMFRNFFTKDPTLFLRDGKFYLAVPFEVPEKPVIGETAVGVDIGERQLFVTSEGKAFSDKTYLRNKRKVRYLKRRLQSNGTKSARRKLKSVRRKEMNMTNDMCHRAANALVSSTEAPIIVMEKLKGIKTKTSRGDDGRKRTGHNRRLGQVPMAQFQETVRQKAQLSGKKVETVSPVYTSQTDSRTGQRDGERRGRRYICKDGIVLDADWNAAVNIGIRSKHPLSSSEVPIDGGLKPLGGRPLSTGRLLCKSSERLTSVRGLASPIL